MIRLYAAILILGCTAIITGGADSDPGLMALGLITAFAGALGIHIES